MTTDISLQVEILKFQLTELTNILRKTFKNETNLKPVFDKIDLLIRHMETGNGLALPVTTTQTSV